MFLVPLLKDLNKFWNNDFKIFDAYLKKYFILRIIIFCMINDYSAYGNLSCHRTKRAKIYLIYGKDTHTVQLKKLWEKYLLGTHAPYNNQLGAKFTSMSNYVKKLILYHKETLPLRNVCTVLQSINNFINFNRNWNKYLLSINQQF
jgi:Transposase family tnp2